MLSLVIKNSISIKWTLNYRHKNIPVNFTGKETEAQATGWLGHSHNQKSTAEASSSVLQGTRTCPYIAYMSNLSLAPATVHHYCTLPRPKKLKLAWSKAVWSHTASVWQNKAGASSKLSLKPSSHKQKASWKHCEVITHLLLPMTSASATNRTKKIFQNLNLRCAKAKASEQVWQTGLLVVSVKHWCQLWIKIAPMDFLRRALESGIYEVWGLWLLSLDYWASRTAIKIPIYTSISGDYGKNTRFLKEYKMKASGICCTADQIQLFSKYLTQIPEVLLRRTWQTLLSSNQALLRGRKTTGLQKNILSDMQKEPSHPAQKYKVHRCI